LSASQELCKKLLSGSGRPTVATAAIPVFSSADSSNGHLRSARPRSNRADARPVIIFDCNGVLVGSEEIAAAVLAEELTRAGIAITPQP